MNPVTPRWRFTLAAKFTLLSLAIVLVTTGAISRMIYREEAGEAQAQLMAEGMNLLDMLRHGSSFPLYVQDQAALRNLSLGASHFAGCAYVRYSDPNGEALVDTPFREQVAIPSLAESMEGTESSLFHDHVVSIRRVGSLIDLSMVVSADEDAGQSALFPGRASQVPADVPLGRIQVGLDTAAIDARLRALLGRILFSAAAAASCGVLLTVLVVRRITRPLAQFVNATSAVAAGDLEREVEVQSHDELRDLSESFTRMLVRLRLYRQRVAADKEELNDRVRERTQELNIAKDQAVALAERAQQASRSKSEFLANMSHEIRTPLNGVVGMTELLIASPLSEQQRRYAETAQRSAAALLEILNDVLDYSKIEAGRLELENEPFDMAAVAEEVADLMASRAHRQGLELAVELIQPFPPRLVGDAARLRQVLTNLISNAVKFTSSGEVVTTLAWTQEADRPQLRIEVKDTGIGISAEDQAKIFDAFVQADGSTTRRYGGTGLGLAICRRLIEQMGGTLGVESTLGKGSTFWITAPLPVASGEAGSPEHAASVPPQRVLVVDDNATNRRVLLGLLASWRIDAEAESDAAGALATLTRAQERGLPFDLVLTDLAMPERDGLDLIASIRNTPEIAAVRCALLTSLDGFTAAERLAALRVERQVSKPVTRRELHRLLSAPAGAAQAHLSDTTPAAGDRWDLWVLLAEDSEVNQEVATALLDQLGCQVTVVNDGQQAVEAVASGRAFDLVLMDCQMPELDGFDATRAIRRFETETGKRRLPIVALTAFASDEERQRCLAAGMDGHLSKPVRRADLWRTLEEWFPGETRRAIEARREHAKQPEEPQVETLVTALAELPNEAPQEEPAVAADDALVESLAELPVAAPDEAPVETPVEASTASADDPREAEAPPESLLPRLDTTVLDQLAEAGRATGRNTLQRVIDAYRSSAPALATDLERALDESDAKAAYRVAHSWKSNAAAVGAARLSDLVRRIDDDLRTGDLTTAHALRVCLLEEHRAVLEALDAQFTGTKQ